LPAVAIVTFDHLFRGIFWPESVFGVMSVSLLRSFEHFGWVVFEVTFLIWGITQGRRQIREMAGLAVELRGEHANLEERIRERTSELNESKQFLQDVLDSLPLEICIVDPCGHIIKTNAEWSGHAIGMGQPVQDSSISFLESCRHSKGQDSDQAFALANAVEEILKTGDGFYRSEYRVQIQHREGWYQVNATPLRRQFATFAVISSSDVSERVRAEQATRDQKDEADRLALVARYTDNAVAITDAEGCIEWVNDGFTRLSGYSMEEVLGRATGEFLEGEKTDPEVIDFMDSKYRQLQGFNVEIVNYAKSGKPYWISREVRPIRDGDGAVNRFIAIEMNITEKKEREMQLDMLKNAVDYCNDSMFLIDSQRRIIDVNLKATFSLEYEREELVGMLFDEVVDGEQSQINVNTYLRCGVSVMLEETHRTKSGKILPVEVSVTPVVHDGEQYCCIFARDVSERRKNEREREKLADELQIAARQAGMAEVATGVLHNVGNILNSVNVSAGVIKKRFEQSSVDRLEKLAEMTNKLEGDFVGFVNHDQRGPLIPQYIDRLAHAFRKEQQKVEQELSEMTENISHIKEVIAMQQSMAKSRGVIQKVALGDLINSAINANKSEIVGHNIRLVVDVPEKEILVQTDKHKVIMILVNLIKNARESVVDADNETPKISVMAVPRYENSQLDGVSIYVEDNGLGIPKERIDAIFQHGKTTKRYGHGFGLHSSANAAMQLNASLTAQSEGVGCGATFILALPVNSTAPSDPPTKQLVQ
ncbi:MAG: PAS domain S-box protein, partial [Planctomycetota bacterium]